MDLTTLSWLEREVLLHLAQGYPTAKITETFSMSQLEYRNLVAALQRKFKARTLQEAVVLAYQQGHIQL